MKIQVLWSWCPTCQTVFDVVSSIIKEIAPGEKVEYITDVSRIIALGFITSPVLLIWEKARAWRDIPTEQEIRNSILEGMSK